MHRCLWCNEDIFEKCTLLQMFMHNDCLCPGCRKQFVRYKRSIIFEGFKIKGLYVYNDFFASALLQYKGCYDEALAPIFLKPFKAWIKWKYRGYTIVFVPSHESVEVLRGFKHLQQMFQGCGLKMCDCLKKTALVNQKEAPLMQRQQVGSAFSLKEVPLPSKILLVDDVMTTGSSLKAAYKLLKGENRKIKVLCVSIKYKI